MTRAQIVMLANAALLLAVTSAAHGPGVDDAEIELVVNAPAAGLTASDGLAAWERIYAVVSHPRCANCHVDERHVPMWSDALTGEREHGMYVAGGDSRMGAETMPCVTCHRTSSEHNVMPHGAPHTGHPWMLAPVEFAWYGKDSQSICEQMRDPSRNGGRDGDGLVEHIVHDAELKAFIVWGFNPGGGREPAPGTMQAHLDDMVTWTAAGMPCPGAD